jgi:hypothetical protein
VLTAQKFAIFGWSSTRQQRKQISNFWHKISPRHVAMEDSRLTMLPRSHSRQHHGKDFSKIWGSYQNSKFIVFYQRSRILFQKKWNRCCIRRRTEAAGRAQNSWLLHSSPGRGHWNRAQKIWLLHLSLGGGCWNRAQKKLTHGGCIHRWAEAAGIKPKRTV